MSNDTSLNYSHIVVLYGLLRYGFQPDSFVNSPVTELGAMEGFLESIFGSHPCKNSFLMTISALN